VAVVSVTTDLTTLTTDADTVANWSIISGTGGTTGDGYGDMKSIASQNEVYIEGGWAVSGAYTTNNPQRGGIGYSSTQTLPTDAVMLIWMNWVSPPLLGTYANAGQFALVGSSNGNYDVFAVSGSDLAPNPVGGWYCYAVDPVNATPFETVGNPGATTAFWGGGILSPKLSRGLIHLSIDAIRVGRGSAILTGGTAPDTAAVLADISDVLQPITTSSGLFEAAGPVYLMQGRLQLGTGAAPVRIVDTNKTINIRNTPAVGPNFNRIEVNNGSSIVTWTGITVANTGVGDPIAPTASRGDFAVNDGTVSLTSCAFADMGTFTLNGTTTVVDSAFRRCDAVTAGTATSFSSTTFRDTIAQSAVDVSSGSAGQVVRCNFIGDGTSHAVNLGTVTGGTSMVWNSTYTGYAATSTNAAATTGASEVLLLNVTSGLFTINVDGSVASPTYRNTGAGTVVLTGPDRNFTLTGLKDQTEVRLIEAATRSSIAGVETVAGGVGTGVDNGSGTVSVSGTTDNNTFNYAYQFSASTNILAAVISGSTYEMLYLDSSLQDSDKSIPVQQQIDRNYNNP